ncbi:alpha-L-rhamnosidase [Paenibacillus sp. UNCCL117]|uniref:alpha-L-rhamnosidase n=1 Tax=unclassified Paenibacillus TaxID=185978 RepID=UPI00088DFF81|nr:MULTISPECIES: alpha-L-rhamnosidase [unclassified Paenibacillus]SDD04808.1 alpha-L-rhamnosidase [Paenibacillus sp. cl123]SFW32004.1 alpha-L-rhamnosidase [Paenibacillus sp. UNCCL117]
MSTVTKLRCEYRENPIGIDVRKPRISWQIRSDSRAWLQAAYQLQLSDDAEWKTLLWDSGKVISGQSVHVEIDGLELASRQRYYYRVRVWSEQGEQSEWSETAFWEMGLLEASHWLADWISAPLEAFPLESEVSPLLRRSFTVDRKVASARVYATGLGLYELYVNGCRAGDCYLTPGWTSYNHQLQYQTYDVTHLLASGPNAIGAILGNGWYKGSLTGSHKKNVYGDRTAFLMQLHIRYEGEAEEVIIATDTAWKARESAIRMSGIYEGETYDARLEIADWCDGRYDDQHWHGVETLPHTKHTLTAQMNEPVRITEKLSPIKLLTTPAGETVLDMGQNMVGWVRFTVRGEAGRHVMLEHAEVLDREGNFYTDNLRDAKQTIRYTLKGGAPETFEPRFTFQGFRYVKLTGFGEDIRLEDFTGIVLHSDMELTGDFRCSEPLINQLQHNILWGQKGNFLDVPTDCPQRDERLGWTGDAQMFIRTAAHMMNVAPFFTKWLRDLAAEQREDGGVPFVIPHVLKETSHSSAAWGDAAVICPWVLYQCYGDKRILEQQYESMKAWVAYIRSQGENEYLWTTGFHFGDWLGLDAKPDSYVGATDRELIATAFYAYSASLLAKTARVLGKTEDASLYEQLHGRVRDAFRQEFITPGGRLAVPTQTAHVLALMFNLAEDHAKERAVAKLMELLQESGFHLTTGFVGTPYLNLVLSQNGQTDAAYKLLLQTDYPSWLYQVTKGATTIWEHWDGIKEDGSFWSKHMNSFNHYAYGAIGEWLYRYVAGIDVDEAAPGYKHVHIRPQPHEGLTWAEAALESMYGRIHVKWHRSEQRRMDITVVIPPNATASIQLPGAQWNQVLENGETLEQAAGIGEIRQTEQGVALQAGSGEYRFTYDYRT